MGKEYITLKEYKQIISSVLGINIPFYPIDEDCGLMIADTPWLKELYLKELSSGIKREELPLPWEE